jgi:uncharacterized OB-fold protein
MYRFGAFRDRNLRILFTKCDSCGRIEVALDNMVPVIGGVSLSKSVEAFAHAISPAES